MNASGYRKRMFFLMKNESTGKEMECQTLQQAIKNPKHLCSFLWIQIIF